MTVQYIGDGNTSGTVIGKLSTNLVGFHGATPISQRASATLSSDISLFALSGASFVANTSSTVSGLFGFNSTMAVQLVDAINEIRDALAAIGIHKGGT